MDQQNQSPRTPIYSAQTEKNHNAYGEFAAVEEEKQSKEREIGLPEMKEEMRRRRNRPTVSDLQSFGSRGKRLYKWKF